MPPKDYYEEDSEKIQDGLRDNAFTVIISIVLAVLVVILAFWASGQTGG